MLVGAMGLQLSVSGRVGVLEVSGVITPRSMTEARLKASASFSGHRCRALLFDVRAAVVAMSADELTASAVAEPSFALIAGVFLVSASNADVYRLHAWQMAQLGVLRVVRDRQAQALEWAQMQAELHRPRTVPLSRAPDSYLSGP